MPRRERGRLQSRTQSAGEEEGEDLCASCAEAVLPSPAPPPGWAGTFFLSLHGQARFTHYSSVCVHVPGSTEALSSLGRMWASCRHIFFLLFWGTSLLLLHGFAANQGCLVLWLSEPAFFE